MSTAVMTDVRLGFLYTETGLTQPLMHDSEH